MIQVCENKNKICSCHFFHSFCGHTYSYTACIFVSLSTGKYQFSNTRWVGHMLHHLTYAANWLTSPVWCYSGDISKEIIGATCTADGCVCFQHKMQKKTCILFCPFSLPLLYMFCRSLLSSHIPETNIVCGMIKQFPDQPQDDTAAAIQTSAARCM
jgi:hypothetical protein